MTGNKLSRELALGVHAILQSALSRIRAELSDLLLFGFAGIFIYGIWLIYQPAAFIIAGLMGMTVNLLLAREGKQK